MLACGIAGALALAPTTVLAQRGGGGTRIAEGRVLRASASGAPLGVANQWVVLHRVGSDRAAPIDSMRSSAGGTFRFRYALSGAPDALYFVSSTYSGIAYFSPPLREDTVRGGDADVLVYDTSTDTSALRVQGRHLVITGGTSTRRDVAEIFEIENESALTVIARDSVTPVWTTRLPAQAESASVAPGDVSADAVVFRNGTAAVFAPIPPGVRQLVFSYSLPASAFPLSWLVQRELAVLEVLLDEPRASVEGARLAEVDAASIGGRDFRRFLATDVPANAVVRITMPRPAGGGANTLRFLAIGVAVAMIGAFAVWLVRRGREAPATIVRRPQLESEALIAELAALDARYERMQSRDESARAAYERERAALKQRIARSLAGEGGTL